MREIWQNAGTAACQFKLIHIIENIGAREEIHKNFLFSPARRLAASVVVNMFAPLSSRPQQIVKTEYKILQAFSAFRK